MCVKAHGLSTPLTHFNTLYSNLFTSVAQVCDYLPLGLYFLTS